MNQKIGTVKDILEAKELTFILTYPDGEERAANWATGAVPVRKCTCKPTEIEIDKNRHGDGIDWILFNTEDSSCRIQILDENREINREQEACGRYDLTIYK